MAKGHFDKGAALYEQGRYREAEEEFLQAYDLSRLPDLLFNLAKSAERQGRPEAARAYLERYLRERPQAPDRPQIEADIERLRRLAPPQPPSAAPVTTAAPAATAQPSLWSKLPPWPALALGGGGVVLLVTGIALGGAALSAQGEVNGTKDGATFPRSVDDRGRALSGAAIAFDVIGVAALGAGAVWTGLWLWQKKHPPRAALLPQGPGLQLVGRF